MKSRIVDTVTNDDENLRLRIFDGEIPLDSAGAEKLRLLEWGIMRSNDRAENLLIRAVSAEAKLREFRTLLGPTGFRARARDARETKPRRIR